MKALLMNAIQHPLVKAAATTVLAEIATKGIGTLVEDVADAVAYKIAYHMVQLETETEIEEEKEERKLCLVTT